MNVQETAARISRRGDQDNAEMLGRLAPKLAAALLSALMNRAVLPGGYFPFGAALMAAVPQEYAAAAAVGGVISCLTDGGMLTSMEGLRHVAVLLAVGGIRWALGELKRVNTARFYPFFTALAGVLLTNTVINGTTGSIVSYASVFFLIEGVMAGLAAMLFSGAAEASGLFDSGVRLGRQSAAALIITLCAAAIPLCRLNLFGLSPGLILLHAAVMSVLPSKREIGGAVGGISAGCVTALARSSLLYGAVSPVAALMAGYAAAYGRIFAASVYIAVCFTGCLTSGQVDYGFVAEAAAGAMLSCVVPREWTERVLNAAGLADGERPRLAAENGLVAKRLQNAAAALTGVSSVVEQVSEKLNKINSPDSEAVYRRASEKVCGKCALRDVCANSGESVPQRLSALSACMRNGGAISGADVSEVLGSRCIREDELAGEINSGRGYDIAARSARTRVAQVRSVINEQLGSVGMMLDELGREIDAAERPDEHAARLLASRLTADGYGVDGVRCTAAPSGRQTVTVQLQPEGGGRVDREDIADLTGECLGGVFECERTERRNGALWLKLRQKPVYALSVGGAQHCHSGEQLCGDAYETFEDDEGSAFVLLSDGMGSGGRAAIDGAMTCGLLSGLLAGGFGFDSAVRLVNASLMIKSEEESLATVDCLRLNLFSGRAVFCKAGAAQSYYVRDGAVTRVDIQSLPLGILCETDTAGYGFTARDGDLIVMLSDGVPTDDSLWFEKLLEHYEGEPPAEFARFLLQQASSRRLPGEDDDITVLVGAVQRSLDGRFLD